MSVELRTVYNQYVAYYSGFREEFDRHVGSAVPARFIAPLLSFDEFVVTWQRWSEQGTLAGWQRRFEQGYDSQARGFSQRISDLLDAESDNVSVSDAA